MKTTLFKILVCFAIFPACGVLAQPQQPPSSNAVVLPPSPIVANPTIMDTLALSFQPASLSSAQLFFFCEMPFLIGDWQQKHASNKNGKLDEKELAAMQKDIKEKKVKFEAEMLAKYDTNKDGKLDEAESKVMKAEQKKLLEAKLLEKYDKNKNGKLDTDEQASIQKDMQERFLLWSRAFPPVSPKNDTNKDGKLEKKERAHQPPAAPLTQPVQPSQTN